MFAGRRERVCLLFPQPRKVPAASEGSLGAAASAQQLPGRRRDPFPDSLCGSRCGPTWPPGRVPSPSCACAPACARWRRTSQRGVVMLMGAQPGGALSAWLHLGPPLGVGAHPVFRSGWRRRPFSPGGLELVQNSVIRTCWTRVPSGPAEPGQSSSSVSYFRARPSALAAELADSSGRLRGLRGDFLWTLPPLADL